MATDTRYSVDLASRSVTGKKVGRLRRQGIVPVHIYGGEKGPVSLQADGHTLSRMLPDVGTNVPVGVNVPGEAGETICFVREVQRHPVSEALLHVDFMRVDAEQRLQADVPLVMLGEAPAVRDGGTLVQQMSSVPVEALPLEMPASIEVDVSGMEAFDTAVHISDLAITAGVDILAEAEDVICRVLPPRKLEGFEIEEMAEEAAEAAEGETDEASEEDAESAST